MQNYEIERENGKNEYYFSKEGVRKINFLKSSSRLLLN